MWKKHVPVSTTRSNTIYIKKEKEQNSVFEMPAVIRCTETSRQRGKQGEINELPLISLIDAGANYWPDEM